MPVKPTNESAEDYLERILMLQEQNQKGVHAVDIANSMGFSKASVSVALKKLEEEGYVQVGPKQVLILTDSGMKIAKRIYERHEILGSLFVLMGVPQDKAYEDACKIEHDLSVESFEALKKIYQEKKENLSK